MAVVGTFNLVIRVDTSAWRSPDVLAARRRFEEQLAQLEEMYRNRGPLPDPPSLDPYREDEDA